MQEFSSLMEAFEWLNIQGFVEEFHLKSEGYWHAKSNRLFLKSEIEIIYVLKAEETHCIDCSPQLLALIVKKEQLKGYYLIFNRSTKSFDYGDN